VRCSNSWGKRAKKHRCKPLHPRYLSDLEIYSGPGTFEHSAHVDTVLRSKSSWRPKFLMIVEVSTLVTHSPLDTTFLRKQLLSIQFLLSVPSFTHQCSQLVYDGSLAYVMRLYSHDAIRANTVPLALVAI
jgi:hypothetical protein